MTDSKYPDLDAMCRLCLAQNLDAEAKVNIFPSTDNKNEIHQLSVPMRIMTCAALEVHATDSLPKQICTDCRYQLEKSYYFRKRCQASDGKLRKHIRLVNSGKKSAVFVETSDDMSEDESDFSDSLQFLKEQEKLRQKNELLKQEKWKQSLEKKSKEEMLKYKRIVDKCNKSKKAELRQEIRAELNQEVHKEVQASCRKNILTEFSRALEEFLNDTQTKWENDVDNNNATENCADVGKSVKTRGNKRKLSEDFNEKTNESYTVTTRQASARRRGGSSLIKRQQKLSNASSESVNIEHTATTTTGESYAVVGNDEPVEISNVYILESEEDDARADDDDGDNVDDDESAQNANNFYENKMENVESSGSVKETTLCQITDIKGIQVLNNIVKKSDSQTSDSLADNDENVMVFNIEQRMDEDNQNIVELVSFDKKLILIKSSDVKDTAPSSPVNTDTEEQPTFVKHIAKEEDSNADENKVVHTRNTDTPKTFKCKHCPTAFSTLLSLERHLRNHELYAQKGVAHQCSECHIFFSCKSALTRHMVTHTGQRPHVCLHCGKSFVQRDILTRHQLVHTGRRPHKCDYCERAFTQKANLTQHINQHHTLEPKIQQHSCHLCPKRFNHASGLSRHLTTHSGIAFQCTECDRIFGDRSSVKRHVASVHGMDASKVRLEYETETQFNESETAEQTQQ